MGGDPDAPHHRRKMPVLRTKRLVLRSWRDTDREPFAALNADPEVMQHFPNVLSRAESDTVVDLIETDFRQNGYGLWALEECSSGEFVGFTGLSGQRFTAPFTPAVEVGWRLRRASWGQGYATEAARAALAYGFDTLGLPEIVSFTTISNVRSQAVMRRLGMTHHDTDDFDHPSLPPGHPLRRHVLFRLPRPIWLSKQRESPRDVG
jgi:ribosomal-protein-alanine N-acetyltransferase